MDISGSFSSQFVPGADMNLPTKAGSDEQSATVKGVQGVSPYTPGRDQATAVANVDPDGRPASLADRNYSVLASGPGVSRIAADKDFQLPPGHTYQPYIRISHAANEALNRNAKFNSDEKATEEIEREVIRQLSLSERKAKLEFNSRFEYRLVDYGYTSRDGSTVNNYGVFAKAPVIKGDILGVYSGTIYLVMVNKSFDLAEIERITPDSGAYIREKLQLPDYMSYYRTMLSALKDKQDVQRTIEKYRFDLSAFSKFHVTNLIPDHERYTPMHFVNSANTKEGINVKFTMTRINTGLHQHWIPVCSATRNINPGEELLADYCVNIDENNRARISETAEQERTLFESTLKNTLDGVAELNRTGLRIPTHVDAPVHYVSRDLQKQARTEKRGAFHAKPDVLTPSSP